MDRKKLPFCSVGLGQTNPEFLSWGKFPSPKTYVRCRIGHAVRDNWDADQAAACWQQFGIEILPRSFDQALRSLHLVDRNDPLTEMVARKIIEVGASTMHDPREIAKAAVKLLGIS